MGQRAGTGGRLAEWPTRDSCATRQTSRARDASPVSCGGFTGRTGGGRSTGGDQSGHARRHQPGHARRHPGRERRNPGRTDDSCTGRTDDSGTDDSGAHRPTRRDQPGHPGGERGDPGSPGGSFTGRTGGGRSTGADEPKRSSDPVHTPVPATIIPSATPGASSAGTPAG